MKYYQLPQVYLRIADEKYHVLKNILEGYDNMGIISKLTDKSSVVILRYPCGLEREMFELLADLAGILKKD